MEISLIDQQRINIKFLAKLGKNGWEIQSTEKEPTVYKWLKRFRERREDFKHDSRFGRLCTSSSYENVDRVPSCVYRDRRSTVIIIADELNLNKTVIYKIIAEDLHMTKLCENIVPKLVSPQQMDRRVECCQNWTELEEANEFLDRVIIRGESWSYEFQIVLKSQSMKWKEVGEPKTKKK